MKLALIVAVAAVAVACSSSSESSGSSSAPLPACTWPAKLDPPENGGTWSVGRAVVQCTGDCVTEVCVSNDPTSCPGEDSAVGGSSTCTPSAGAPRTCVDECKPNEYGFLASNLCNAATCAPTPPSSCYVPAGVGGSPEGVPMCSACE